MHDFFALQGRFWFFTLTGLAAGLTRIDGPEVEVVLLLSRESAMLDQRIDVQDFGLYCTPVVNLFAAKTGRAVIDPKERERRLTPVVNKSADFEVHSVDLVYGQVDEDSAPVVFQPLDEALLPHPRAARYRDVAPRHAAWRRPAAAGCTRAPADWSRVRMGA